MDKMRGVIKCHSAAAHLVAAVFLVNRLKSGRIEEHRQGLQPKVLDTLMLIALAQVHDLRNRVGEGEVVKDQEALQQLGEIGGSLEDIGESLDDLLN